MSWIKMRCNLWDDPRVLALCDATDSQEATVIGGLYWLWTMADQHTTDGHLPGLTPRQIDRKTGIAGFADALMRIGWIAQADDGLLMERFTEHNGTGTKQRLETALRVANFRAKNPPKTKATRPGNAEPVTSETQDGDACNAGALPREEKNSSVPKGTGADGASDPLPWDDNADPPEPPRQGPPPITQAPPADPPPPPPPPTAQESVWAIGPPLLMAAGVKEGAARSFLGLQVKAHTAEAVHAALVDCAAEQALEPLAWLTARLRASPRPARTAPGSWQEGKDRQRALAAEIYRRAGWTTDPATGATVINFPEVLNADDQQFARIAGG